MIDNAEDEKSIQAWIPKTGSCRTLITSRFAGWSAAIKSIHLYVLDPEPARALLVTRAGLADFASLSSAEQSAVDELAQQLGYLPLALEQAAAYIEQQGRGFGFGGYLRLYQEATRELLAAGVLGSTEYPDAVMTTWSATTAKLAPGSRAILRLCSFLAPTPLPLTVLLDGVAVLLEESADVAGAAFPPPSHAEFWVREQVQQLRAYSMVEGDSRSIQLHPLVQKVEQLNLQRTTGPYQTTLARSLHWINTAFVGDPRDVRSWPVLDPLALHAGTVAEYADQDGIAEPTARLLNQLGQLCRAKSQHAKAEPLMRQMCGILLSFTQRTGHPHPHLNAAFSNYARLLKATGLSDAQVRQRLNELLAQYGMSLG